MTTRVANKNATLLQYNGQEIIKVDDPD